MFGTILCNATVTTAGGSYGGSFRLIRNQSHLYCLVGGPPLYFKARVTKQLRAQSVSNYSLKTVAPWALGLRVGTNLLRISCFSLSIINCKACIGKISWCSQCIHKKVNEFFLHKIVARSVGKTFYFCIIDAMMLNYKSWLKGISFSWSSLEP